MTKFVATAFATLLLASAAMNTPASANGVAVKVGTKAAKHLCKKPCRKYIQRKTEYAVQKLDDFAGFVADGYDAVKDEWNRKEQRRNKIRRLDVLHRLPVKQDTRKP